MDWPRYYRLMENCTPTLDCGVHYYDIAQWIAGSRITEVNGFGVKTQDNAPNENYTLVSFEMENGCKGYYEVGWGKTIRAGDIMLFQSNTLVIFYDTFESDYAYTRIGSVTDPDGLAEALGPGDVRVEWRT